VIYLHQVIVYIVKYLLGLNSFILDSQSSATDKMNLNHLSPMARKVTQNHGTEPPFSSPLNNNKQSGIYSCIVCNTPVFRLFIYNQ